MRRKMIIAIVALLTLTTGSVCIQMIMKHPVESVSASTNFPEKPLSDVPYTQPSIAPNSKKITSPETTSAQTDTPTETLLEVPIEGPIGIIKEVPSEMPSQSPVAVPISAPTPIKPESEPVTLDEKSETVISIPVLNYHSIGKQPGNTLILDPDKFAQQMAYLKEHQFSPLSLSDFILILEQKKVAPPKPILLTFDDGYSDNYELAMPILKEYGYPATLFMSPGSVEQEGYLSWEQVKEMHKAGWDIQPHGMTHPHLPKLSAVKQQEEIVEARKQIEQQLGTTADVFCYPYGEFNKHTLAILKEEGFRYAFTIQQGITTSNQQPLELKRLYVNGKESLHTWSKKLLLK